MRRGDDDDDDNCKSVDRHGDKATTKQQAVFLPLAAAYALPPDFGNSHLKVM